MRNGFGAPGRGHPSSPRSRSERQVAHGHPSRSAISPTRATWPSANRTVTPSSRLTSRSEEHTSELQSLMRISYAVFCLKKKIHTIKTVSETNNKSQIKKKYNK